MSTDYDYRGSTSDSAGKRSKNDAIRPLTFAQNLTTQQASHKKFRLKSADPSLKKISQPASNGKTITREYRAGFFSRLFFQWITPLMALGYKGEIQDNDVWVINPKWKTDVITTKVQESFEKRVAQGNKYALIFALYETFKREFWIGGLCQLLASLLQTISPLVLRYLIVFAQDAYNAKNGSTPAPSIWIGLGLVFGITLIQLIQSLQINQSLYHGMIVGGAARAALISLIFEKSLKISGRARAGDEKTIKASKLEEKSKELKSKLKKGDARSRRRNSKNVDGIGWSNGIVMNLMSLDSHRVDQASAHFHMLWTAPISCIITLVLLTINLSYSALAGFGFLTLGVLAISMITKRLFLWRKSIDKTTDQRISLTQEIVKAVNFVKLFGWESAFLSKLQLIRKREIHDIQILLTMRNAMNTVTLSLPIFSSMLTYVTYSLTGHLLEPAVVFSSLALFNSLRIPLNLLPSAISQVTDAWSSVCRIQQYLISEEIKDEIHVDSKVEMAVEMKEAEFSWERIPTNETSQKKNEEPEVKLDFNYLKDRKNDVSQSKIKEQKALKIQLSDNQTFDEKNIDEEKPFQLKNINLSIRRNELVAVIGGVGSGKSSLLGAIAGEIRKTKGELRLGVSRSFCPQSAWIQNTTIKKNILFGKEIKEEWYNQVLNACSLRSDLEMLPQGDATEIGERGVNLSGGQKQRINIARAIYFDADLILMDDPLSAVDAHVGSQIFDIAVLGLLKKKCRILATHQLWILSRCDRIIWMEEGHIRAFDTFENLLKNDVDFQTLMENSTHQKQSPGYIDNQSLDNTKIDQKTKQSGTELMQTEERAVGSIPWSIYMKYIRASGSFFFLAITLVFLIAYQFANIITSLWLSWWVSDYFGYKTKIYIAIYVALGILQALFMFAYSFSITTICTISSKSMMNHAMAQVLRAPMSFFYTTPLGRITNRFSRDVYVMDNELPDAVRLYFVLLTTILATLCLVIAYFPYFSIAVAVLSLLFYYSTSYFLASGRQLKRIESTLRSNVFAKFSEGLSGTACIRAYGLQGQFSDDLKASVDNMNSAYFLNFANQRWLSVRVDFLAILMVLVTGILVITSRFNVRPSIVGLILSYILTIVHLIQLSIRQLAEVEQGMNATERLHHYKTSLEEEAPLHTIKVRKTWPESGEIIFRNVTMRYRPDLPFILSDLNLHIKGGERIGIVGRTGAGKSSILMTLFRLVELSAGTIIIDGIDISKIGLHDIRSRLAIIPQDPSLFKGTIRSNLDPFSEFTDLELWSALRQSDLVLPSAQVDDKNPGRIHLDSLVDDEGLNFSLGQRQLMALARALVRNSQIIICDEATSSVDMETDVKIQHTMATAFKGRTLLCIAHRLKTIINYDRICVLEHGRIVEMDTPKRLREKNGIFKGMCDRNGIGNEYFDDSNKGEKER
ncbi:Multidrug resistance protein fer6 [Golovinomyces cichoracearum]|uniref:Multidrug resistance protein fer6 n=1 Tax=Golovinomyces cichoracearum TaxID=62708 RepID=A0A420J535_9PEZI|nr:Multidrug resistance protein fer6 [Golovinomyces cichoracearum]